MAANDCETISIPEAAAVLGFAWNWGYRAAKAGHLPVIRLRGKMRVPVLALGRLLENPSLWSRPTVDVPVEAA